MELQERKPRFLCIHGFRTSGEILKKQVGKWPESVLGRIELVYVDAPFPAHGKSDVEGFYSPPYYEWFQFNEETMEYGNLEECFTYIEDCMVKHAPIDGLLGFSQGAILSGGLAGLQAKGLALTKVPKIKSLIIIGGAKFSVPMLAEKAYLPPIKCPSIHIIGEKDFMKPRGIKLLESFVNPVVIQHPVGHTVPRLDEKSSKIMLSFLEDIQKMVSFHGSASSIEVEKETLDQEIQKMVSCNGTASSIEVQRETFEENQTMVSCNGTAASSIEVEKQTLEENQKMVSCNGTASPIEVEKETVL